MTVERHYVHGCYRIWRELLDFVDVLYSLKDVQLICKLESLFLCLHQQYTADTMFCGFPSGHLSVC